MTTELLPPHLEIILFLAGTPNFYIVQGSGILLILIHRFGISIGHWRQNVPVLNSGSDRVLAIALLGFGGSDLPGSDY